MNKKIEIYTPIIPKYDMSTKMERNIILPTDGIYGSELFKLLLDIPEIKFDLRNSRSIFPCIPSKYIGKSDREKQFDGWNKEHTIVCYTEPTKLLMLAYCHQLLVDRSKRYFWMGLAETNELAETRKYLSWVGGQAFDENFSDENLYIICDFLIGPLGRERLDNLRYKKQKKMMIRKYEAKYVLMECLADVRPLLITLLIMLEHKNEQKYITTYLFQ